MRFVTRQPFDPRVSESWCVCDASALDLVEASFSTRDEAEAYAQALSAWAAARPVPGEDRPHFSEPGSLDGILDRAARIEPSDARVLEFERQRLVAAQAVA